MRQDSAIADAPAAQTPIILVPGERAFTHRATPVSNAPFPSGATTASIGSGQRNTGAGIGLLLIGLSTIALRRRSRADKGCANRNSKLGGGSK